MTSSTSLAPCWSSQLTDGELALIMRFTFTDEGLIDAVRAEARGRMVGDTIVPPPWYGRF